MKKLTFERACLAVFILIILISTSEITGKYIEKLKKSYFNTPIESREFSPTFGFPTMLMNADNLFKERKYEEAANEYLAITLNTTSIEQKAQAYFQLGLCHYYLGKYDRAADSFEKVTSFSPDDSLAYNNAAVSAYMAKDINKAIELQKKALDIHPAVEYYHNLARMYEDTENYEEAADYFYLVAVGENSISKVESIDPVRAKEKVARLSVQNERQNGELENDLVRVYKLSENREILTINENEMQLKPGDFTVRVEDQNSSKSIVAEYDRKKYDPYNLISELLWTVYKDGRAIYKNSKDRINFRTQDTGTYEVALSIKYNGNKEKISKKSVKISPSNSIIEKTETEHVTIDIPIAVNTKTYENAIYEQLFESDFNISAKGYSDRYNVVWGKDDVETNLNKNTKIDKLSSLSVTNTDAKNKGIWINLDSILSNGNDRDRTVSVSFYAKKISPNAKINLVIRIKSSYLISTISETVDLSSNWEQHTTKVFIPRNATGFTISMTTSPGEQFCIDQFIIVP